MFHRYVLEKCTEGRISVLLGDKMKTGRKRKVFSPLRVMVEAGWALQVAASTAKRHTQLFRFEHRAEGGDQIMRQVCDCTDNSKSMSRGALEYIENPIY